MTMPTNTGGVLHEVSKTTSSRLPFLILLAILCLGPIYFVPPLWPILGGSFAVVAGIYMFGQRWADRRPHLVSICENGLAASAAGQDLFIPWSGVASVTAWSRDIYCGYDINANQVRYRLADATMGRDKVRAMVDTVVSRAKLEWIHDNIATRPENAGELKEIIGRAQL